MKPKATPTAATVDDYRAIYGRETMVFGTTSGRSYHWYQSPYVVLNIANDGTRKAYETEQRHEPLSVSFG